MESHDGEVRPDNVNSVGCPAARRPWAGGDEYSRTRGWQYGEEAKTALRPVGRCTISPIWTGSSSTVEALSSETTAEVDRFHGARPRQARQAKAHHEAVVPLTSRPTSPHGVGDSRVEAENSSQAGVGPILGTPRRGMNFSTADALYRRPRHPYSGLRDCGTYSAVEWER